jgi:hypothetical protein
MALITTLSSGLIRAYIPLTENLCPIGGTGAPMRSIRPDLFAKGRLESADAIQGRPSSATTMETFVCHAYNKMVRARFLCLTQ